ncbi:MAG: hypothetical protein KGL34_13860 [Gammaproteobacteria bacterium]|nr:hypothetical protein [Gammaproteobacteria bacterium]
MMDRSLCKKIALAGVVAFGMAAAGLASAHAPRGDQDRDDQSDGHRHRQHIAAPEMDPVFAAGALALLAGGIVVIRGRVKKS